MFCTLLPGRLDDQALFGEMSLHLTSSSQPLPTKRGYPRGSCEQRKASLYYLVTTKVLALHAAGLRSLEPKQAYFSQITGANGQ